MKNNYRNQKACSNCKFVLADRYDDLVYYFCNIDKSITIEEFNDQYYTEATRKWEDEHSVFSSGICDDYQ